MMRILLACVALITVGSCDDSKTSLAVFSVPRMLSSDVRGKALIGVEVASPDPGLCVRFTVDRGTLTSVNEDQPTGVDGGTHGPLSAVASPVPSHQPRRAYVEYESVGDGNPAWVFFELAKDSCDKAGTLSSITQASLQIVPSGSGNTSSAGADLKPATDMKSSSDM